MRAAFTCTFLTFCFTTHAFQPCCHRGRSRALFSSVGDGGGNRPPPPDDDGDNPWSDFLDPNKQESESLQKAREFFSENSLPISFEATEDLLNNTTNVTSESSGEYGAARPGNSEVSGGLALSERPGELIPGSPTKEQLMNNPYMAVVTSLSPSELISKFTSTTHPRVQNAVRSTILSLIGSLPKMAFETNTVTTGQRLASLMFQLQMTGYMFKNAEYKLSMSQAVSDSDRGKFLLKGSDGEEEIDPLEGKIRGKLRVKYVKKKSETDQGADFVEDDDSNDNSGIEVDADAYMSELRSEVMKLRDDLTLSRKEKEEAVRKDLLQYIRTLPEKELRSLTNTMSEDVLVAMKGLVNAVISGIGEGQIGPSTVTEQSGEAMAQLCLWQLAIGYNLRTLEVREEMKKSLAGGVDSDLNDFSQDGVGGFFNEPGALQ